MSSSKNNVLLHDWLREPEKHFAQKLQQAK